MHTKLTTERFTLQIPTLKDVELFHKYTSDSETSTYTSWWPPNSLKESEDVINYFINGAKNWTDYAFGIYENWKLLWLVWINEIKRTNLREFRNSANLWYWLYKDFRQRWIMTECAKEVLRFAFEDLKLHKVNWTVYSDNIPSQKTLTKLWFRHIWTKLKEFSFD